MLSNSALECMRDVRYVLRVREIFQSFSLHLPVLLLLQISHPGDPPRSSSRGYPNLHLAHFRPLFLCLSSDTAQ
jgi:hypothetical protein